MASKSTKRALEESLKSLMDEKPFTKITVADIAARSGVSRMTFYYHFQNIYDLVEWVCAEDAARVVGADRTPATWRHGLLSLLRAVSDNRALVLNVYRSAPEHADRFALPALRPLAAAALGQDLAGEPQEGQGRFAVEFFAHALAGVLLDWIDDGMRVDPELVVERVGSVMGPVSERASAAA